MWLQQDLEPGAALNVGPLIADPGRRQESRGLLELPVPMAVSRWVSGSAPTHGDIQCTKGRRRAASFQNPTPS